jgi:hypothetical protein
MVEGRREGAPNISNYLVVKGRRRRSIIYFSILVV